YVASTRGWVFAVNADTGKLVWKAQVPLGGGVNSTVAVADRRLPKPPAPRLRCSSRVRRHATERQRRAAHRCAARKRQARRRWKATPVRTAGTVYVNVTRTQKGSNCTGGDACIGPYVAAFDQQT